MSMKSKINMSSSFMPPTSATIFHYPIHGTTQCEDLKPTDTPSTVPTALQASPSISSCSLKLIGELMTQVSSFSGEH